jgi:hypothetical protein
MQEFESILESESKKALKRLREYIKDISSFYHPNSTSFNEAIFKDVFLCLEKMVETFNNLKIYMEENKKKAFSYFVGNDIKYYNDIISFIFNMEKSVETSKFIADVNDINVEAIALIKTINLYVKNNQIKLNQEIYLMEKWKYENFEKYIKNIFKVIQQIFMNIKRSIIKYPIFLM